MPDHTKRGGRSSGRGFREWERGSVPVKARAPVRIALAYPNRYAVGMASLGFQTVYRLWNAHPDVRCERVFLPERSAPLRSFESGEPLSRFDLLGFSVSFELDVPNVFRMLIDSGIPPLAQERTSAHPLVFFGGAVGGLNPSPLLPFVDGLLAGEGEGPLTRMADVLARHRRGRHVRDDRLDALSEIEGVYVRGRNQTVRRHVVMHLEPPPAYTPIVTPFSHFSNMFVVETARGCPRGCLFCAACKVHHPFRHYTMDAVSDAVDAYNPGAAKIGLEGAGLSDYPHLPELCSRLVAKGLTVSFSSVRVDRVSESLVRVLTDGGARSFAVAPEAGSESMRRAIGKDISDRVLFDAVRLLSGTALASLKLYYMIGLPGESDADVDAIAESVGRIGDVFLQASKSGGRRIRLSVNAFIPKAFTEYQWAAMERPEKLKRKRKRIAGALGREKRITLVPKSEREEVLQGMLSMGDNRVGEAVFRSIRDRIAIGKAFRADGVDADSLVFQRRRLDDVLPWDFIHHDIPKERLWRHFQGGPDDAGGVGHGRC